MNENANAEKCETDSKVENCFYVDWNEMARIKREGSLIDQFKLKTELGEVSEKIYKSFKIDLSPNRLQRGQWIENFVSILQQRVNHPHLESDHSESLTEASMLALEACAHGLHGIGGLISAIGQQNDETPLHEAVFCDVGFLIMDLAAMIERCTLIK